MKKIAYIAPEMEVVKLKLESPLMVVSTGGPGKDDSETPYDE